MFSPRDLCTLNVSPRVTAVHRDYRLHDGQTVTVVRPFTPSFYMIEAADGWQGFATDTELKLMET